MLLFLLWMLQILLGNLPHQLWSGHRISGARWRRGGWRALPLPLHTPEGVGCLPEAARSSEPGGTSWCPLFSLRVRVLPGLTSWLLPLPKKITYCLRHMYNHTLNKAWARLASLLGPRKQPKVLETFALVAWLRHTMKMNKYTNKGGVFFKKCKH